MQVSGWVLHGERLLKTILLRILAWIYKTRVPSPLCVKKSRSYTKHEMSHYVVNILAEEDYLYAWTNFLSFPQNEKSTGFGKKHSSSKRKIEKGWLVWVPGHVQTCSFANLEMCNLGGNQTLLQNEGNLKSSVTVCVTAGVNEPDVTLVNFINWFSFLIVAEGEAGDGSPFAEPRQYRSSRRGKWLSGRG